MRKRLLLLSLAAIPANACAGPAIVRDTPYGAEYRQLTGTGLRAAVAGRFFSFPQPEGVISSPRCHRFHEDGTYEECGDRVAFYRGTYTIAHDRFCATGGPSASCWQLYAGSGGNYLLRDIRNPRADTRVCISPPGGEYRPCP
jgi:hypothetical protein